MRRIFVAAGLAVFMVPCAVPQARAQIDSREGIALQNQILELRQEMQQLQQMQSQAGGQPPVAPPQPQDNGAPPQEGANGAPNDLLPSLVVRVSALEEQMRTLQGKIADLANTEQHDHDDLAKQIGDLAFKLGQGAPGGGQPSASPDNGMGAPPPADNGGGMDLGSPRPQAPPPPALPTHRTAELALKQGNAALARRDYAGAEAAAREVLAVGHGPHAPDGQYLLARAQMGQHDYKASAASFYAVYKASPRSPRGAEGLIGVANSLAGLGDSTDACQAVAKFNAEFPKPEPGLRAQAASVRKRAGCR
jgi:TolA-binding protein